MNIALIDSHQIFTEALKVNLLKSLPTIGSVAIYSSVESFFTRKSDDVPTIVITELSFNGKYDKGLDLIFPADPKTSVIILTSINDDWLVRSYMKLGARAFLTKTCNFQELLDAIAQVRKGNLFLSEDVQNILSAGINSGKASVEYLSSLERAFLEALSRDEPFRTIANNLNISMIELKYHRRMLMERFGVKHFSSLTDLVRTPGFLQPDSKPDYTDFAEKKKGAYQKPLSRAMAH